MKDLKNQENSIRDLTTNEISAVSGGEDIVIIDLRRNVSEKVLAQICLIIIIIDC